MGTKVSKDGKVTKAWVQYREYPSGTKRCGKCAMFQAPTKCSYVRGEISEHGYCRSFKLKFGKVVRSGA